MEKILILGYDGLEPKLVDLFLCNSIMQKEHGKTDISEFNIALTPVLWGSFILGKNVEHHFVSSKRSKLAGLIKKFGEFLEGFPHPISDLKRKLGRKTKITSRVLGRSGKEGWDFDSKDYNPTIFDFVENSKALFVPTYSEWDPVKDGRKVVGDVFTSKMEDKEYWDYIWENFYMKKEELLYSVEKDYNLLMCHIQIADSSGHRFFSDLKKMKKVYRKLDSLTKKVKEIWEDWILIVSDHGMERLGKFGTHSNLDYGFYSSSKKFSLNSPKFTEFFDIIADELYFSLEENR